MLITFDNLNRHTHLDIHIYDINHDINLHTSIDKIWTATSFHATMSIYVNMKPAILGASRCLEDMEGMPTKAGVRAAAAY
jgi:hypothetical protein